MTTTQLLRHPMTQAGYVVGWAVNGNFDLGKLEFMLPRWWRAPPSSFIASVVYEFIQPNHGAPNGIVANIRTEIRRPR